jgi:hypothetical protein
MKTMIRIAVVSLLCLAAGFAYSSVPVMNVSVSDASGKAAFKGMTDSKGAFATANLKPGSYVVQINSKSAAKGTFYAVVVSAGKKKVSASAVPAEKFAGGGVALKVDVGAGLNISGQVAAEDKSAMKNGKKMIWIPPMLGSNQPGHWVEEGSAEEIASRTRDSMSTQLVQQLTEKGRGAPNGN